MIDESDAIEYEVGRSNFLMSILFAIFPNYFVRVARRNYKRYREFMEYNDKLVEELSKIRND